MTDNSNRIRITVELPPELDLDVEDYGSVYVIHFDDMTAFLGAPRSGDYGDIDVDALRDQLDERVEETVIREEEP